MRKAPPGLGGLGEGEAPGGTQGALPAIPHPPGASWVLGPEKGQDSAPPHPANLPTVHVNLCAPAARHPPTASEERILWSLDTRPPTPPRPPTLGSKEGSPRAMPGPPEAPAQPSWENLSLKPLSPYSHLSFPLAKEGVLWA